MSWPWVRRQHWNHSTLSGAPPPVAPYYMSGVRTPAAPPYCYRTLPEPDPGWRVLQQLCPHPRETQNQDSWLLSGEFPQRGQSSPSRAGDTVPAQGSARPPGYTLQAPALGKGKPAWSWLGKQPGGVEGGPMTPTAGLPTAALIPEPPPHSPPLGCGRCRGAGAWDLRLRGTNQRPCRPRARPASFRGAGVSGV